MTGKPETADGGWVNELVIDYGFDELPYTYCPGTDDICDHDQCMAEKRCRNRNDD